MNRDELVRRFREGDIRALARSLTWVENRDPRGRDVLAEVYEDTGRARVIGITGPPGAGKSTLVDVLSVRLAEAGRKVGIIAVDPSSSFSGGAILGDRIRMRGGSDHENVYIRSMATRGHLGGLARATGDAVDLLDAFGFDDVLIETVGVGQDEIEVVQVAAFNYVVLVPFLGDDVQAIKAGIMEIADAYVINKADRDGVDRMEAHLRYMLQLYEGEPRDVPILRTVATRGEGLDEMIAVADERAQPGGGKLRSDRDRVRARVELLLRDRLLEEHQSRAGAAEALTALSEQVLKKECDPYSAVDRLLGGVVRLDHLGLAVPDAAKALEFWRDQLGLEVAGQEEVASEGVRVTFLPAGEARLELLEPMEEGQGAVGGFLSKRGAGIHHVCLSVPDIEAALTRLREGGAQVIGEAPRPGAEGKLVAFVHPRSTGGVLLELSQEPE